MHAIPMIGALPDTHGTRFRVWAASTRRVDVLLNGTGQVFPLAAEGDGYYSAHIPGVRPGARYMYRLDGGDPRPDPASRSQPDGVHAASCVVDPGSFAWRDAGWLGLPPEQLIIYELHVGAATAEGSFDALIGHLDTLRDLGITAIELMPVADFPGERNWGYDGVCLFAPAHSYGGPDGLRRLVAAAHARGLAVLLDVVYNHLGPDGNYLRHYSRAYFTSRYKTPWGDALNLDGPGSTHVRDFLVANALHWVHEYHIDGFRLDATHALHDASPHHILAELASRVRAAVPPGRHIVLIAEHDGNESRLALPLARGGYGLDAIWADDFHHQVRVALAGDHEGYYADYTGTATDLAATVRQGWFYTGQRSRVSGQPRGRMPDALPYPAFVYCIQNHDQVGNRALGDRLHHSISLAAYRAASALLLLAPATPMLWMGQEWAASSPFLYFTDHHAELGQAVTAGRRREFADFAAFTRTEVPDPQAAETFLRSKLNWDERDQPPHAGIVRLYHDLLALRRSHPAMPQRARERFTVEVLGQHTLALRYTGTQPAEALLIVVQFGPEQSAEHPILAPPEGLRWQVAIDTEDAIYGGEAHPHGPRAVVWTIAAGG